MTRSQPELIAPEGGGDVAASRKPDAIVAEIEHTRAELADTIDAIADRISPKRAASRGAAAVRAQVDRVIDLNHADRVIDLNEAEANPPESAAITIPEAVPVLAMPSPKVLVAAGAAVAVVGGIVVVRRRS